MEWDGERINDYFVKLFNHINTNYSESKRPKSIFFNRMRIIDHAYKDFFYECGYNAWAKDKLLGVIENIFQLTISDKNFDYSDYDSDFKKSDLYMETQKALAKKYKEIAENYSFNFDNPTSQILK